MKPIKERSRQDLVTELENLRKTHGVCSEIFTAIGHTDQTDQALKNIQDAIDEIKKFLNS